MPQLMTSPRTYTVTYEGKPEQVRRVRWFLSDVLGGCPAADDAILLTSEIAANAVQHSDSGKGGTFILRAEIHDSYAWIEVEDQGGKWTIRDMRADGRGHGLDLVSKLASEWAIDGNERCRVVSFRIDWALPA
jgi:anti-sigma regulatory factor (Ser/Thr protein kinase)